MGTFIWQTEHVVENLNAENERLQVENDRISYLLRLSTEALKRRTEMPPAVRPGVQLRDPFRPDHPTREEARMRRENAPNDLDNGLQ